MGQALLEYLQLGKEATPGTLVAATRRYAPSMDSLYNVDVMDNFHESRATGRRNPISYASSMGTMVTINYQTGSEGVSFNELPTFTQFPDGSTASGTAAPFTWAHSFGGTASGSYVTYTAEFGDNIQEYETGYVVLTDATLSAEVGGMTMFSGTFVGQQAAKSTKTSLSVTDDNRIPAYLWQWKHASSQSGLGGASFKTGELKGFQLQWQTGLTPAKYLDGQAYFTKTNEYLPFSGTLTMVLVHNSNNVTEVYDQMQSQTVSFIELNATGTTLGASNWQATIDMAVIYESVEFGSVDGETTLNVTARLVYDDTWGKSMLFTTKNNRSGLPA